MQVKADDGAIQIASEYFIVIYSWFYDELSTISLLTCFVIFIAQIPLASIELILGCKIAILPGRLLNAHHSQSQTRFIQGIPRETDIEEKKKRDKVQKLIV